MTNRRKLSRTFATSRHWVAGLVLILGLAVEAVPLRAQAAILVDDDGAQCAGSVRTIQQAVAAASTGSTILVCSGTYQDTVNLIGHEKDGIKIIAAGAQDQVILQGDHMQRDGFHLEDVNGVLIQGFTVRDFGSMPTTATVSGMGNNIFLLRSNQNSIRHNRLTSSNMMGIYLVDSAENVVEDNITFENDVKGNGCGIMLDGRLSMNNVVRRNLTYGNPLAGIMILNAGTGNLVADNNANSNGQWGIDNRGTNGTIIEGNRASRNVGRFMGPNSPVTSGAGINVRTSTGVMVKDNTAHDNMGFDIYWDNTGTNIFVGNGVPTSVVRSITLANTTDTARNPNFRVGDSFRVDLSAAPPNAPVFLRIFKNGQDLGISGPYGGNTDAQGKWSLAGRYEASAVGSWLVQAIAGGRDSIDRSAVIAVTITLPPMQ